MFSIWDVQVFEQDVWACCCLYVLQLLLHPFLSIRGTGRWNILKNKDKIVQFPWFKSLRIMVHLHILCCMNVMMLLNKKGSFLQDKFAICCGFEFENGLLWISQWPTLHLQVVQDDLGICHVSPLRRVTPTGSLHVCRMSYDRLSARQGSVTQRGQHSPSATAVYSHINTGQTRGQQSTSPSYKDRGQCKKKSNLNCFYVLVLL